MHRSAARAFACLLAITVLTAPLAARAGTSRGHTSARPRWPAHGLHIGALGVIPVRGAAARAPIKTESPSNKQLEYHKGPVMHSSTTYVIYWEPVTCGIAPCSVAPGYNAGIDTYFIDSAADSGLSTNVYSTLNQYYDVRHDERTHVQYAQTFGGSYVDTTPFPANGCTGFHYGASGVCISDTQIQAEVQSAMTATGWTGGKQHAFFVVLPGEVDTCYGPGACAFTEFCAYHSAFLLPNGRRAIYANIPYAGTNLAGCSSGKIPPNGEDLDATLNSASHEHREMTNDPFGTAWWDDQSQNEGSDLCAYRFGPDLGIGGVNSGSYNQLINGDPYLLQMEWSNKSLACKQRGA